MTIDEITSWVKKEEEVQHSRSSGPGGQNINKVNTRVTLRLPLARLPLSARDMLRLEERLASKTNSEGDLIINSGETRSQLQNLRLAELRAVNLIQGALERPKKRRKTKPTRASKERRLSEKKHRSEIKKTRRLD